MEQGQCRDDHSPTTRDAMQIPIDLMWFVAGIDNQELGKRDVGPEQNEGEQQVAQLVVLAFVDHFGKGLLISKQREHDGRESVSDQYLSDNDDDCEYGGIPVLLQ